MRCKPCEGGVKKMRHSVALRYMPMVKGWKLVKDKISRELKFKDFKGALSFLNKVGKIAESQGHHPDICIYSWNHVRIELQTHAIGGLSQNDFIVAAKINNVLK